MNFDNTNIFWNTQALPQQQNQIFQPMTRMRGQSNYPYSPRFNQPINNIQNPGGQGYSTPGYPPQGLGIQQQVPMPQNRGYQAPGYSPQGFNFNQGYYQDPRGQMPLQQPAWEEPKKGGIKGFISNLMAKRKR